MALTGHPVFDFNQIWLLSRSPSQILPSKLREGTRQTFYPKRSESLSSFHYSHLKNWFHACFQATGLQIWEDFSIQVPGPMCLMRMRARAVTAETLHVNLQMLSPEKKALDGAHDK